MAHEGVRHAPDRGICAVSIVSRSSPPVYWHSQAYTEVAANDTEAVFVWDDGEMRGDDQYFGVRMMMQLMPYYGVGKFAPGDVDLDLVANVSDAVYLIDYIFGGFDAKFWPRDLPDMNGDGVYGNVADIVYLLSYIFAGGPEPYTPYEGIRPPLP